STTAAQRTVVLPAAVIKADNVKGEVSAIVNTGYPDLQHDTMGFGCWEKVVKEKQRPPVFWAHDLKELPLGSVIDLQELAPGDPRIPLLEGKMSFGAGALMARVQFALKTSR